MKNVLSLLGIAKKAGFLEIGEESVQAAAKRKKARVILSAADASDGSKRRARGYAEFYGIAYVPLPESKAELAAVIGRGSPGMAAVTDFGLAAALVERLAAVTPETYGETAAALRVQADRAARRRRETAVYKRRVRRGKTRGTGRSGK